MSITKLEQRLLRECIRQIDTSSPDFRGSDDIKAHLSDSQVRLYLTTWVLPKLRAIADQDKPELRAYSKHY